jgi:hypothetical protein
MAAEATSSQALTSDRSPLLFGAPVGYILVTSQALTNVANALPGAGRRRYLPRYFVSSPSAAPTALLRSAFLAFPGCHQFHFDLDQPID